MEAGTHPPFSVLPSLRRGFTFTTKFQRIDMRYTFLLVFVAALFMTACKKTGGSSPGTSSSASLLIKSSQTTEYLDTTQSIPEIQSTDNFTYDNKGRVKTHTDSGLLTIGGVSSVTKDTITVSYGNNTDTSLHASYTGTQYALLKSVDYYNPAGTELDSTLFNTNYMPGLPFTQGVGFIYDANGNCTNVSRFNLQNGQRVLTDLTSNSYSGGNLVEFTYQEIHNNITTLTFVYNLTYGTVMGNYDYEFNQLPQVPGRSVAPFDLLTSYVRTANGLPSLSLVFAYTFDAQHRVTSYTGNTASGKPYIQVNITYEN